MRKPGDSFNRLATLVATLRGPEGCPWDRNQSIADIRGYLLEEAHEVAAAIDLDDWEEIQSELGDLLFQIVFVSQIAHERGEFEIDAVVEGIEAKMIERHPHVFGSETLETAEDVRQAWERRKVEGRSEDRSVLEGVPDSLPALLACYRMTQKASAVGFDWPETQDVVDKMHEELAELSQALDEKRAQAAREEVGDLLFTAANLARKVGLDPESTLASANQKFRRRFRRMEEMLNQMGRSITTTGLDDLEEVWEAVKSEERQSSEASD